MRIEIPKPQPRKDGEFMFYVTVGYGEPHGTIWLDEAQSLVLDYVDAEDCDRIIRAVAEVKSQVLEYRAQAAVPHGKNRVYHGTCQLCGKPEGDELHAEPEPALEAAGYEQHTCDQKNPQTSDWCIAPGSQHGHHWDTYGETWTTAGDDEAAPSARQQPRPADRCKCGHIALNHHLNQVTSELVYCNECPGTDDCAAFSPAEPAEVTA